MPAKWMDDEEKARLRAHTKEIFKTYSEIKGVFMNLAPMPARAVCEEYGWFIDSRAALVTQIKAFREMKDKLGKIDSEAMKLYDDAAEMNQRTVQLIDSIVQRAKEPVA